MFTRNESSRGVVGMHVSRKTWCRVCRRELRLPIWQALIGLSSTTCKDHDGCLARYHALSEAQVRAARSSSDRSGPLETATGTGRLFRG